MKYTVVDPLTKPEPVMVRGVPPVIAPDGGDVAGWVVSPVTVGSVEPVDELWIVIPVPHVDVHGLALPRLES